MAPRADPVSDWQLSCLEIKQRGAALLRSGEWSDCEFLVGSAQAPVRAHKLILAMASPVFAAMFLGALAEGELPVRVPDMEPEAFAIMLKYIYSDCIDIQSCGTARNLYYGAQKYMLLHLMAVSKVYLSMNLEPDNVCQTYEFAVLFGVSELKEQCLKLFQSHTREILQSSSFADAQKDTVVKIFSQEQLYVDSEMDLFKAAERYAQALVLKGAQAGNAPSMDTDDHCDAASSETETSMEASSHAAGTEEACAGDKNPDLLSADINTIETAEKKCINATSAIRGGILEQIQFLAMSSREFAEYDTTSLLSDWEIMSISLNLHSPNTYVNFPIGFSTCSSSRIKAIQETCETVSEQNAVAKTTFEIVHVEAKCLLVVKNIRNVMNIIHLDSETFYIRGLPWSVQLKHSENNKLLLVFIACNTRVKSSWCCQTEATFKVLTNYGTERLMQHFNVELSNKKFWKVFTLNWEYLLNPSNGIVKNETLTMEVHIKPKELTTD